MSSSMVRGRGCGRHASGGLPVTMPLCPKSPRLRPARWAHPLL